MILGLTLFTLISCDKDKDGNGGSSDLVGIWTVTSSSFEITINNVDVIDYLMAAMELTEEEAEMFVDMFFSDMGMTGTIEFKSDGTYITKSDGETDTGTWKLSSDKKTLTMDDGTADEVNATVVSLTSSKLVVEFTESESDDWDEDGTPETTEIFMHIELSK